MTVLIDTNILVYAVNFAAAQHGRAKAFVEEKRNSGCCLTWSILYEWARVVTHPRVFAKPLSPNQAKQVMLEIARDPRVEILVETPQHSRFLEQVLAEAPVLRGNLYHDAHIAALMREHGVTTIATADRHFRLFPEIQIVDPTTE